MRKIEHDLGSERGVPDAEEAVHGGTDRLCLAAGGSRNAGSRDLPKDGRDGSLEVAEGLRGDGCGGDPAA